MKFKHKTLSNGLQIVAEVNPQAYSAAFGFFVNAGSRDETAKNSGVSHFLEHMAFKGTPTRSAEDVNRQLDEMGSHSNARTGEERTIYHAAVLPEFQTPIVELLCDLMRPSLRDDDFDVEKKVIIEEILDDTLSVLSARAITIFSTFQRASVCRGLHGSTGQ